MDDKKYKVSISNLTEEEYKKIYEFLDKFGKEIVINVEPNADNVKYLHG